MIAAEQPVAPSQGDSSYCIFGKVIIYPKAAVQVVSTQFVINSMSVFNRLPNTTLGQNFGIFVNHPFFKGNHNGVR